MKFTISSDLLKYKLNVLNGVIASNPVIPILDNFLLTVNDNKLTISATDLETFISSELSVSSDVNGSVAVPAKILTETLKQLPTQPITFEAQNNSIKITSAFGEYTLAAENGSDYPKVPQIVEENTVLFPAIYLLEGINKTYFATSTDELRPALTGVLIQLNDKGVTFVSTDAQKLVTYNLPLLHHTLTTDLILPKKALNLLKSSLMNITGNVKVSFSGTNAFFYYEDETISCRLIDAKYPQYQAVIPKQNNFVLEISRQDFTNSLKRITNFANKTTNQVRLTLTETVLKIEAEDTDYSNKASEKISCIYRGEDLQIGFNGKFLIETLNNLGGEHIKMYLSDARRAGLLQNDNENLLMLIMPIVMN